MRPLHGLVSAPPSVGGVPPRRRVDDAMIGVVTDNADPRRLGRVRVALPALSEHDATAWATIAAPGAGARRGWFFVPEVNDEVVVVFEHGDIDRPIVIGALWNGAEPPPERQPRRRVLASTRGNRIVLDDDALTVTLEDGGGHARVTLDARARRVTLEALAGDVSLRAPAGTLSIVAARVELRAGGTVSLRAAGPAALGARGAVTVRASSVALAGAPLQTACGAARAPAEAQTSPAAVPDPYTPAAATAR